MGALNFLLVWAGYWVLSYGVATVRGCNVSFSQIGVPGKFQGCNPDQPGASDTSNAAAPGTGVFGPSGTGKGLNTPTQTSVTSVAQAQSILANPKSTAAQKQAATDFLYSEYG